MASPQELQAQYEDQLLEDENVSSVGIGLDDNGNEVMIVGVKTGTSTQFVLPQSLQSEPVQVEEVGEFTPEVVASTVDPQAFDHKGRHRPVPAGVSAGHPQITAGTVGFVLTDGSQKFTGSNNHVYANVNNASAGDAIYQPGPTDGGTSSDQAATLEGYIQLEDGALVDYAWGSMDVEFENKLADYATPTGSPRRVQVGDVLKKSGRTTGVTEGTVKQVSVTVTVNYGSTSYTLKDQIFADDMSDGGDSGSAALFKSDEAPAGVIFAGNDNTSVLNQAVNVESETGLQIVTENMSGTPTAQVNLEMIRTGPDTGNVQGQVVDADTGSGLEGVSVNLQGDGAIGTTTDQSGEFFLTDVAITRWDVTATKDGYEDATAVIEAVDFQ